MYVRKTYDEYILMGNWGYGWDEVTSELAYKEIKQRWREYVENGRRASYYIRKVRRPIDKAQKK